MLRYLLGLALLFHLQGADVNVSGKWVGEVVIEDSGGDEPIRTPVQVEFQQAGQKLSGKIGRVGDTELVEIQNGSAVGNKVSFEARAEDVQSTMRFSLAVVGDAMRGEMRGKIESEPLVAKVSFQRQK